MKKFVSLLLACVLIFSLPIHVHAESSDSIKFTPIGFSTLGFTATEWFSTETNRTILATVALLEYLYTINDETLAAISVNALANNAVYVGRDSWNLMIFFFGDNEMTYIIYNPYTEDAYASLITVSYQNADFSMQYLVADGMISSYYQVDSMDILVNYQDIFDSAQ